ncbi:MAG: hypothetical protein EPO27_10700 [Betaproteobacteria bacterium]|nr:MAG: hypothetical protein EPO27_10700 [Betaproteobacteria bacterium]
MAQWDESKKFWTETARTVLLGVAGALAILWVVKPWEKDIEYRAELSKTVLAIRARVVDEFLAASYRYTALAYDACRAYQKPEPSNDDQTAINLFQGEAVDSFRSARNRLDVYFESSDLSHELLTADRLSRELFALCRDAKTEQKIWEAKRQELRIANNSAAMTALRILDIRR